MSDTSTCLNSDRGLEDLLRHLAPRVPAALVRRHGDFDVAEDAVQEALLAAASRWPDGGVPDSPDGWLIRVASRRIIDQHGVRPHVRADDLRAGAVPCVRPAWRLSRRSPGSGELLSPASTFHRAESSGV